LSHRHGSHGGHKPAADDSLESDQAGLHTRVDRHRACSGPGDWTAPLAGSAQDETQARLDLAKSLLRSSRFPEEYIRTPFPLPSLRVPLPRSSATRPMVPSRFPPPKNIPRRSESTARRCCMPARSRALPTASPFARLTSGSIPTLKRSVRNLPLLIFNSFGAKIPTIKKRQFPPTSSAPISGAARSPARRTSMAAAN